MTCKSDRQNSWWPSDTDQVIAVVGPALARADHRITQIEGLGRGT